MLRNADCISFLLGKAYQHVNQAAKQRLAPYGVTPVQFALLNVLWAEDGLSGADLGVRLQLDSATITGVIDRLAHIGLVERRPDPVDRRINRVHLTVRGSALQAPLSREIEQFNAEFFGIFSPADARRLQTMLALLGHVEE
ncbi:MAG: MarR family winged helix-turn-helix transcriptional regulator [Roseiflexaceae bacterium]